METTRQELGFAEMILRKGRPKKKKAVPAIKKSEVEEKLLFEIEMREAAQRLLSACSNPQQRFEAAKTIVTSNSRTLALMTALQKEHVKEVEEAHGITDLKDKDEIMREEMMESVSLADVTITNVTIPLKWCRIDHNKYKTDCWKYQVFCLIRSGIQVLDSSSFTKVDLLTENIVLNDTFVLKNLIPDFVIDLEFYYTQTEDTPKQKKSKKGEQADVAPPVFAIAGTATLSLAHCNIWSQKQSLRPGSTSLPAHITAPTCLPDLPPLPVLNFYRAEIDVLPHFTLKPSKEGFLDVQQMTAGMPYWARNWCSLQGMYLKTWKQPEEQFVSEPTQVIDINEHMMLDHIPRASVQRPNTIHLSYCKSPYVDHFISTDTKEERILWEIALRKAMINSSTWHPNKLSSAQNHGTCPSPLKSPPPKPPRPLTEGQFSYTPSNPCLPAYRAQYEAQRSSRKDRLLDWTPMKRSKSAERKPNTPAVDFQQVHRSRANTCKKPSRRRSRSVELTPIRSAAPRFQGNGPRDTPASRFQGNGPRDSHPPITTLDTPKRDRVSDATYVSMHKFSRVSTDQMPRPVRQPPRPPQPPSLSKLPGAVVKGTPSRPLSKVNESYRAAVTKDTPPSSAAPAPGKKSPSRQHKPQEDPSGREQKKLQVDLSNREHKKKAPKPQNRVTTPERNSPRSQIQNSRSKKSPAPAPQRPRRVRVPRQSEGGTNNLDSPNRSDLKNKEGIMNLYLNNDTESFDLSPSIKIANTPSSTTSTPTSFAFEFENIIDEAFGSIEAENTALSSDITPSFHPASDRKAAVRTPSGPKTPPGSGRSTAKTPLGSGRSPAKTPGLVSRRSPAKTPLVSRRSPAKTPLGSGPSPAKTSSRKVSRNTPLTSTMKQGAPEFDLPGDVTAISGPSSLRRRLVQETTNITPITEEEEEGEGGGGGGGGGGSKERGESILKGYFDTTMEEEDEEEKENETACNMSSISPISFPDHRGSGAHKRISESPDHRGSGAHKRRSESPDHRGSGAHKRNSESPDHRGSGAHKRNSESPAKEKSPSKRPAPSHRTPARNVTKNESKKKSPLSRSPLNCLNLKGSSSPKRGEVSPADPDFCGKASPITVRPKPKFQVVNGKLMPI